MSIGSQHVRLIKVEGTDYRWKVKDNGDHLSVTIEALSGGALIHRAYWHDEKETQIKPSMIEDLIRDKLIPRRKYKSWVPKEKDRKRYKKLSYSEIAQDVWSQQTFASNWNLEVVSEGPSRMLAKIHPTSNDGSSHDISISYKNRADLPTECYVVFKIWFDQLAAGDRGGGLAVGGRGRTQ